MNESYELSDAAKRMQQEINDLIFAVRNESIIVIRFTAGTP